MNSVQLREFQGPLFDEQWVAGTYLVSGVFFLDGSGLTPAGVTDAVDLLYERTKEQKRRAWPRGLCGYYIIPVFSASSFSEEVVKFVHTRIAFRWAIWPEPVLYRTTEN